MKTGIKKEEKILKEKGNMKREIEYRKEYRGGGGGGGKENVER